MSEQDKTPEKDIVASAEDAPETIGDETLEDAAGGWSWGASTLNTSVVMSGGSTMVKGGVIMDTIYAGSETDDLAQSLDASMLRIRPGRI
ncbi:MAG: hypothetical protein AAFN27_11165 [Pseudomonadota bacterium]